MTVLSDREIATEVAYGNLVIEPYHESKLQPASYDVTLDDTFIRFVDSLTYVTDCIDLNEGARDEQQDEFTDDFVVIDPGEMVLGSTVERFELPPDITLSVEPRSSAARNGLAVDGWGDPGFEGTITLELANVGSMPIRAHAGSSYCQFVFERTGYSANNPYTGRYKGQQGVTPSREERE